MQFRELANKNVVIWGAGREGNAAAAQLAAAHIPAQIVTTAPDVDNSAALQTLAHADVIIKSPGIPHTSPEYQQLATAGACFTSLMDLWLSDYGDKTVAVTGTKGKSTTSSMTHHIFQQLGVHSVIGGNLGIALTSELGNSAEVVVAEVSSYQAAEVSSSPRIGVCTSLYPEHLPWHGGLTQYIQDKTRLFAHGCQTLILPDQQLFNKLSAANPKLATVSVCTPQAVGITVTETELRWTGVGTLHAQELAFHGAHNLQNAALALTAVSQHPLTSEFAAATLLSALKNFKPLKHRLETVPSADGRTWVDDGLATAPEAVIAALKTFQKNRIALLFGGAERGLDFTCLADYFVANPLLQTRLQVIAMGPAGTRFADLLKQRGVAIPVTLSNDFAHAIELARTQTASGDVVLLSPGAPSFNEFQDYAERSAAFQRAAAELS